MALDIDHELRRIGQSLHAAGAAITPESVLRHERLLQDSDADLVDVTSIPAPQDPVYVQELAPVTSRRRQVLALAAVVILLVAALGAVALRRDQPGGPASPSASYWLPQWLPAGYQITHKEWNFAQGVPAIVASDGHRGLMIQWLAGSALIPMAFTESLTVAGRQAVVVDMPTGGIEIEIDHKRGGILDLQGNGWSEPDLRTLADQATASFDGDLAVLMSLVPSGMRAQLVPSWTAASFVLFNNNESAGNVQVEEGRSFAAERLRATYPEVVAADAGALRVLESGSSPGVTVVIGARATVTVTAALSAADRLRIAQSVQPVERTAWDAVADSSPSLDLGGSCEAGGPPADAARADLAPGSVLAVWACSQRYAFFRIRNGGGPLISGSYGLTAIDDLQTTPPSVVIYGLQPTDVSRVVVHLADGGSVAGSSLAVTGFDDRVWYAVVPGQMTDVRAVDSYAGDRLVSHQGRPSP